MSIRFKNYSGNFHILSLALNEEVREDLLLQNIPILYTDGSHAMIFPEKQLVSVDITELEYLQNFHNYDVLEIWENGLLIQRYDHTASDNCFFITGGCNSNCIMCPSPEGARKNSPMHSSQYFIELAQHIPVHAGHLTITGGEPFLMGTDIFILLDYLKHKFFNTEFLILTNGRIFSVMKYAKLLAETIPSFTTVAIPVHAGHSALHDEITRAKGSFVQTITGIQNLLQLNIPIEIRIVISRLNAKDILKIAELIIKDFPDIQYVSFIAMEMTGNARVNEEKVWISYSQAFYSCKNAIILLMKHSIDVRLYNFPLCTVEKSYWFLCRQSISPEKVKFPSECSSCSLQSLCSGIFSGTLDFEKGEVRPILCS